MVLADQPPQFGASVNSGSELIVELDATLENKADLICHLGRSLNSPKYVHANWDSLADCLRDLAWLPAERVVLHHRSWPALPPAELTTYQAILHEVVNFWAIQGQPQRLGVITPTV